MCVAPNGFNLRLCVLLKAPNLCVELFPDKPENLFTAIYQMLSTGEQWNPSDLYKIDMPIALVEKQKAKAIKQAKKLLQRERLLPPDEPLAS